MLYDLMFCVVSCHIALDGVMPCCVESHHVVFVLHGITLYHVLLYSVVLCPFASYCFKSHVILYQVLLYRINFCPNAVKNDTELNVIFTLLRDHLLGLKGGKKTSYWDRK